MSLRRKAFGLSVIRIPLLWLSVNLQQEVFAETDADPCSNAGMDIRESVNITDKQSPASLQERIATFGRALTAKDLAGLLNVSPITIFKQAKKGIIPCFRVGTCVRFEPKRTADWLSKQ